MSEYAAPLRDMQFVLQELAGIHASPTCVVAFGDQGGATGYRVGEESRRLEYVFIMMNAARFSIGLEHRDGQRGRLPRRADPRRHGFRRGDRRRPASARCAHHDDLRGHHRHPGHRPDRPQDRPRRRPHDTRGHRRDVRGGAAAPISDEQF